MSSDSEEENNLRRDPDDRDGGRDDRRRSRSQSRSRSRSPSHSRSRSRSVSRSRSRSKSPARHDDDDDHEEVAKMIELNRQREEMERKANGMTRDSDTEESEARRVVSRSKSPEDNEVWRSSGEKRVSRSRSKSKPKETESSKERDRKSSNKKKSRSKRSRSRSRSRRRSHSRSRRSRSRNRRKSRSRSRSRGPRSRRRSRSRSRRRSRSRSGTPVDGARLHVAELDVDTRKRDLEHVFEKYGRLREIWMARNPPCFAFVVYAHQRDADKALKETDGIMIGHCRIKVTQARPRVRGGRMRGGYDPNLRCYQCGELGHFSRNCTDTKFGYKRPPTPPGVVH